MILKSALLGSAFTLAMSGIFSAAAIADAGGDLNSPMAFDPLAVSATLSPVWDLPFETPEDFTQTKISDETDLDIYTGDDDLPDMNSLNETGPDAGRYLYRTHEVNDCGAVSVVDLRSGKENVLAQASICSEFAHAPGAPAFTDFTTGRDLDGIEWTPWGTLLIAKEDPQGKVYEILLKDGKAQDEQGKLYEKSNPAKAADVRDRPAVGRLCHEGIQVGSDGAVYVVNEFNGGSIFRFVPESYGDLSEGELFALKIAGIDDARQLYAGGANNAVHVGDFEWVEVKDEDANFAGTSCADGHQAAANAQVATQFGRPEDIQFIGQVLYVANTSEDRVLAIDLLKSSVTAFVAAGVNVDAEPNNPGFNNPDNLAIGPDGRLWIVEDNKPSDIWVADVDRDDDGLADKVILFASMHDSGAEGTGLYFGPTKPFTLFVNVQHAEKTLADGTWVIRKEEEDK